ncbi:MAG TPA: PEGA domain-containing protein [Gemmatimonadaceae bacterium]|nr:PEGA domain-containing protein [Gemmatimonadaceae bacterium]
MRRIWILSAALALSGCATIWRQPTTQPVFVDSTPLDARVEVDGTQHCVTMCTLELERRRSHRIVVALSGYAPETTAVRRSTQAKWLAADLTFGLVIGVVVDRLTGRLFELSPDDINASLKRR